VSASRFCVVKETTRAVRPVWLAKNKKVERARRIATGSALPQRRFDNQYENVTLIAQLATLKIP
jgi:hypothetical protein